MVIPRIKELRPLPDFVLYALFDDGRRVLYDVKTDFDLPDYDMLRTVPHLFESVQLDASRTCVYWSDAIDLPSDTIYEYGAQISP